MRLSVVGFVLASGLIAGAGMASAQDAGSVKFYNEKVVPVFQANCYRCHGGLNHRGGLTMDTKAGIMKGGHDGVVLVPGHPAGEADSA